jgi:hypothetical protein
MCPDFSAFRITGLDGKITEVEDLKQNGEENIWITKGRT